MTQDPTSNADDNEASATSTTENEGEAEGDATSPKRPRRIVRTRSTSEIEAGTPPVIEALPPPRQAVSAPAKGAAGATNDGRRVFDFRSERPRPVEPERPRGPRPDAPRREGFSRPDRGPRGFDKSRDRSRAQGFRPRQDRDRPPRRDNEESSKPIVEAPKPRVEQVARPAPRPAVVAPPKPAPKVEPQAPEPTNIGATLVGVPLPKTGGKKVEKIRPRTAKEVLASKVSARAKAKPKAENRAAEPSSAVDSPLPTAKKARGKSAETKAVEEAEASTPAPKPSLFQRLLGFFRGK